MKAWKLRICGHVCLYFADYDNSNSISLWNVTQTASFPGLPIFCHSVGIAQKYIQEVEEGRAWEHSLCE